MGKGKIVYRGNIKKLVVNSSIVKPSLDSLIEQSYVLKKDAYFYKNRLGKMISYDYGTSLPTYEEALDWAESILKNPSHVQDSIDCIYVDYGELKYEIMPCSKVKMLEKRSKHKRKR